MVIAIVFFGALILGFVMGVCAMKDIDYNDDI